jgi:hypothetical protein
MFKGANYRMGKSPGDCQEIYLSFAAAGYGRYRNPQIGDLPALLASFLSGV